MNDENIQLALQILPIELWNTLYMVFWSSLLAFIGGFPLGIILTLTSKGHLKENRLVYSILSAIVNTGRSFPFAILMVAIIPLTRWLVGTSLGTTASIVPLTIAAVPSVARMLEAAFKEIEKPIIEAALVMGSSTWQVVRKVLLPESLPSLIFGMTTIVINIIGYSAMAGLLGGGGLGKIAIQYGYQRFNVFIMVVTVLLLLLIVQLTQLLGNVWANYINAKRGKVFVK